MDQNDFAFASSEEEVTGGLVTAGREESLREMSAVDELELRSDPYFQQRPDALGRPSFTPLQKCIVAIRQLANGGATDQYDEYLRIAESTSLEFLTKFCRAIVQLLSAKYLRRPTSIDYQRLLALHEEKHGFPEMLWSLDRRH
ncbi:uncharacterized protein LOC131015729 [Salvia miltiorrhiza]|uniref:uncharacterized protein LOC131015729 n=1 Tax=Salvia miltiorrhiza TaxID=226208 RepID=UPI0025AD366F|nr:uncharacterized protein LOC131015729 [Salvia miltiorrhiza]